MRLGIPVKNPAISGSRVFLQGLAAGGDRFGGIDENGVGGAKVSVIQMGLVPWTGENKIWIARLPVTCNVISILIYYSKGFMLTAKSPITVLKLCE